MSHKSIFIRPATFFKLTDEMVVKKKNVHSKGDGVDIATELNQYMLLNKQTKTEKSWSSSQKTAFANLLKQYPNGGNLSEFLTCLQASIQVNF